MRASPSLTNIPKLKDITFTDVFLLLLLGNVSQVHTLIEYQNGDVLAIESLGWETFAIVSNMHPGAEKVICFADESGQPVLDTDIFHSATLKEVELQKWIDLAPNPDSVRVFRQQDHKGTILRRARDLLQQGKTRNIPFFHSDHFRTYAVTGELTSPQSREVLFIKGLQYSFLGWLKTKGGEQFIDNALSHSFMTNLLPEEGVVARVFETVVTTAAKEGKTVKEMRRSLSGDLIANLGYELISLLWSIFKSLNQLMKGEITVGEICHQVLKDVSYSIGSTLGATAGSVTIPWLGAMVGSSAGGRLGSYIGSKLGDIVCT